MLNSDLLVVVSDRPFNRDFLTGNEAVFVEPAFPDAGSPADGRGPLPAEIDRCV